MRWCTSTTSNSTTSHSPPHTTSLLLTPPPHSSSSLLLTPNSTTSHHLIHHLKKGARSASILLLMIAISIEIHFTTLYTWRVFEHERSRWAKERRRERASCLCNHSQLKPLRRIEILTNLNIHIAKKVIT